LRLRRSRLDGHERAVAQFEGALHLAGEIGRVRDDDEGDALLAV